MKANPVEIKVVNGKVSHPDYLIHFPVPMDRAWDNVVYTCSVMLMFRTEAEIDSWCARHHIEKGDVQSVERIWEFAKAWYANHLSKTWTKWTYEEAADLFRKNGLVGPTWQVSRRGTRF